MAVQARTNQERVEESTERLLQAAVELFAEKGYGQTTAMEIGTRAGYSRNMVRDRYGSKEELLRALIERELQQRLLPSLRKSRGGTGLESVLNQVDDLKAAIQTEPETMRAILRLAFDAPSAAEIVQPLHDVLMDGFEAEMIQHLDDGVRDGSVRSGLDHAREAEIYVSYGIGLCFRWIMESDAYDLFGELDAWHARLQRAYATTA